jgi:probable HAF family extracellular repeat protein
LQQNRRRRFFATEVNGVHDLFLDAGFRLFLSLLLLLEASVASAQVRIVELKPLPSSSNPEATALGINNSGQVAGWSRYSIGYPHAVMWDEGMVTDLGTFGATLSYAYGINDRG